MNGEFALLTKSKAIIFARGERYFNQPRSVTLSLEPIQWVDTTLYVAMNLDPRLTWSPHMEQVWKRAPQRMGMLYPLLKKKSDLSVRNGFLLYKQLIRSMMEYSCPAWKSAARSHV